MKPNLIAIVVDEKMFPAAAFLATRLATLNPRDDVDIAILSDAEDDLNTARKLGVPAELIPARLPIAMARQPIARITVASFLRLFVPDYAGEHVRRIIYLDTDTYPEDEKIFRLFDLDMGKFDVAAVQDIRFVYTADEEYRQKELSRARVTAGDYFNGGLLLIDRQKFVENRLGHRAYKFALKDNFRIDLVFNRVLAGKWLRLSPAMNFPMDLRDFLVSNGWHPSLTHFIGATKPWHGPRFASDHPARKEIEAYILESPWRQFLSKHYDFKAAWDTLQARQGGPTHSAPPIVKTFDIAYQTKLDELANYLNQTDFADVSQGITTRVP